ncbi:HAD family hydrolase [Gordonia sp. DT30]|uniref:HAD family hydrolase n=1 Tax=unclassified Gordonia (in: high G+C Gram-positive bacteria) TaxID=2657482 RepID=UPI003CF8332E
MADTAGSGRSDAPDEATSGEVRSDDGPVNTVLLDVDGTLLDSNHLHALAWQRAFAGHDLYPEWWRIHRAIGMGGDQLVGEVCGSDVEDSLGDQLRDEWAQRYRELVGEAYVLPKAPELIRMLTGAGYRVALASSSAKEFTDTALEILGISRSDVDVVTSADDADTSKPAPDLLGVALERAGGGPAILVGDSVWDVASASALGIPCLSVRTGGSAAAELLDAGAVRVVDDVAALVTEGWRP